MKLEEKKKVGFHIKQQKRTNNPNTKIASFKTQKNHHLVVTAIERATES